MQKLPPSLPGFLKGGEFSQAPVAAQFPIIGNYLATDQVLAVGGIQFQIGAAPQAQPSGRTLDASSRYGDDEQMTE